MPQGRERLNAYVLAIDGCCLFNQMGAMAANLEYLHRPVDAAQAGALAEQLENWLYYYKQLWRTVSKQSELGRIAEVLGWWADYLRTVDCRNGAPCRGGKTGRMKEVYIGSIIRKRRQELGLTQEQLCRGICETVTLSRIENGKQTPSRSKLNALLQRLGMPGERYYALLSEQEMKISNLQTEIVSCNVLGQREQGLKNWKSSSG